MTDESGDVPTPRGMTDVWWMTLPIGVGLAIGLNATPGWGLLVLIAGAAFSIAEVVMRAPEYRGYRAQLPEGASLGWYLTLSAFWNIIKVGLAAVFGVLIRAASN